MYYEARTGVVYDKNHYFFKQFFPTYIILRKAVFNVTKLLWNSISNRGQLIVNDFKNKDSFLLRSF